MNCFEWESVSSDYLDGILSAAEKREADRHLDHCKSCSDRHRRLRLLISSIANQPRIALPVPIRKAPLSSLIRKPDLAAVGRSRWERLPWFIRTSIEGSAIVFGVLLIVSLAPRIRSLYERRVEDSLSEFNDLPVAGEEGTTSSAPLGALPANAVGSPDDQAEDFGGGDSGDSEDDSSDEDSKDLKAGNSEIWRFHLKTVSPQDLRIKVEKLLIELKAAPESDLTLKGIEVPGGIQFDLLVPQSIVLPLKHQLEKLAPTPEAADNSKEAPEPFTWYKNKSKRKIEAGKSRIVIWLSQI